MTTTRQTLTQQVKEWKANGVRDENKRNEKGLEIFVSASTSSLSCSMVGKRTEEESFFLHSLLEFKERREERNEGRE